MLTALLHKITEHWAYPPARPLPILDKAGKLRRAWLEGAEEIVSEVIGAEEAKAQKRCGMINQ
jgi:hypothetical protein